MTRHDDENPYAEDELGFRLLEPAEYNALEDDAQWAYLKAWSDAEGRKRDRMRRQNSSCRGSLHALTDATNIR